MSDDEILLRACDIWMEKEKAEMRKVLEWQRAQEEFRDAFPPFVDIDKLAETLLEAEDISYSWLKSQKERILRKAAN